MIGSEIEACDTVDYDNLYLFHYNKRCNEDSDEMVKRARGIIVDTTSSVIVCDNFPYTPEYSFYVDDIETRLGDLSNYKIFESLEGTIIRVFFHTDSWRIATTKRINAYESYWGGSKLSFGKLFEKAIKQYIKTKFMNWLYSLNKNIQYLFLLTPTKDTRIVARYTDVPLVYHVGSFENCKLSIDNSPFKNILPTISDLSLKFNNYDELRNYLDNLNCTHNQGVLLFDVNNNYKIVKILSNNYLSLREIRGNVSDIKIRYLQLRNISTDITLLLSLYRERAEEFQKIETGMRILTETILRLYKSRYVEKKYTFIKNNFLLKIVKDKCHNQYYLKTKNAVNIDVVEEILSKENPRKILKLIYNIINGQTLS